MSRKLIIFEYSTGNELWMKTLDASKIVSIIFHENEDKIRFTCDIYEELALFTYYLPEGLPLEVRKQIVQVISIFISDIYTKPDIIFVNDELINRIKSMVESMGTDRLGKPIVLNPDYVYEKLYLDE